MRKLVVLGMIAACYRELHPRHRQCRSGRMSRRAGSRGATPIAAASTAAQVERMLDLFGVT